MSETMDRAISAIDRALDVARDAVAQVIALRSENARLIACLKRNHAENLQQAKDIGGCDHSVGICMCELTHLNEDTASFLRELEKAAP